MYASVEQLREYLDQIPSDSSEAGTDEELGHILTRATSIIDEALAAALGERSFSFAEYGAASTKLVTGYGGEYLDLPAHEAGSVTLVETQTGERPATYTALTADDWEQDEHGRLRFPGYGYMWFYPWRYRVTAIWGYGPAPASIEQITLELAVNIWRSRAKGSFAEFQGAEGGSYQRYVGGLTKMQAETITNVARRFWRPAV